MTRYPWLAVLLLFGCSPTDDEIRAEIAAANYCDAPAECRVVSGKCPFGCFVLINEAEVDGIQSLLGDYDSNCDYVCVPPPEEVTCEKNTCVVAELSEQERIQEQIDRANYCETSAECENVGSVCPFGCAIFVNEAEAASLRDILDDYQPQCDYDCLPVSGVECQDSACVAQFEE